MGLHTAPARCIAPSHGDYRHLSSSDERAAMRRGSDKRARRLKVQVVPDVTSAKTSEVEFIALLHKRPVRMRMMEVIGKRFHIV